MKKSVLCVRASSEEFGSRWFVFSNCDLAEAEKWLTEDLGLDATFDEEPLAEVIRGQYMGVVELCMH